MVDQDIYDDAKDRMKKSIDSMKKDFLGVRTGRATPAILDPIRVPAYGQEMMIKQVASISIPEPRMIIIQPWDQSVMADLEKAIQKSDLGIHPQNDGKLLRLIFPPLTEERRKDLVKVVRKRAEEGKIAIRNIRRDTIDFLKELEKEGDISEDDLHSGRDEVQKITDEQIKDIDDVLAGKEKEIMEI